MAGSGGASCCVRKLVTTLQRRLTSGHAIRFEEASQLMRCGFRGSHEEREAWELRLIAENPFALFETFEKDETEEQREEMRREMEARLRE